MTNMLIFGMGYTAGYLARRLRGEGWQVNGTGRAGNLDFEDTESVGLAIGEASHIISSVPPERDSGQDPVLELYGRALVTAPANWTGYLSSTGVYGDADGAWVDESAPIGTGRRQARSEADAAWQALREDVHVFRLPGIYGPGRSVFDRLREGKAKRISVPEQVFSRIHVEDIVGAVIASFDALKDVYNVSDNKPESNAEVIAHGARLLGMDVPPKIALEDANLSKMAMGFYVENRRVANGKAKRVLGWEPKYPDYKAGLAAILAGDLGIR